MLTNNSNHSFKGVQMTQVSVNSPDQLVQDQTEPIQMIKSNWRSCNIKRCAFLILLVLTSSLTLYQINTQKIIPVDPQVVIQGPFEFPIYCPYSYLHSLMFGYEEEEDLRLRRLFSTYSYNLSLQGLNAYDFNQTYLVQIDFIESPGGQKALYYCGLVTQFGSTCSDKQSWTSLCLRTDQYADIVWINNIKTNSSSSYQDDKSSCMKVSSPWCQLQTKSENSRTYIDPTNMDQNSSQSHSSHPKIQISASSWPLSAHVHGAEVRPTFDGNPMSWIDNNGKRGLGAFSLDDDCYYSQFDRDDGDNTTYQPPDIIVNAISDHYEINRVKISRYPNKQNPGNLWYHDHAMRLTLFNVQHGLAGLYILRNPSVEKQIDVPPKNEKMLMLTVQGWQNSSLQVIQDTVYRFRILNSFFNATTAKISFAYGECTNPQRIYFTQIGADSSLFHEGIENIQEIELAAAQRAQILIKFAKDQSSYSICNGWDKISSSTAPSSNVPPSLSSDQQKLLPKSYTSIPINKKSKISTTRDNITNVKLDVPYTSLSQIDSSQIAVKRMRTLSAWSINLQSKNPSNSSLMFMINGRIDFHEGQSENPTIGTIQDWYIINLMRGQHPIHIHLINFQIIRVMDLIQLSYFSPKNVSCVLYELDFLIEAMKTHDSLKNNRDYFPDPNNLMIVNYENICKNMGTIYLAQNFSMNLGKVNLQSKKDEKTNVSGINVELQLSSLDRKQLNITSQNDRKYKYVKDLGHEPSKPHYKRWKDTGSVDGKTVSVFRIRWAKSAYNKNKVGGDSYFHVPLDQLREYPGFVYHCHILGHEDSEMMRPIMLQLPSDAKLDHQIQCNKKGEQYNYSWEQKVNCINEKCQKQPRKN